MIKKTILIGFIAINSFANFVYAKPIEYENVVTRTENVALTFDACDGKTDMRILSFIKEKQIPITLFVTAKWMDKNKEAIEFIKNNSHLFKIENHGFNHVEAVESNEGAYHLPTVKNEEGLRHEVLDNSDKIFKVFEVKANYYRTAGALYDQASLKWLEKQNIKVGGYTVAADEGAKASKERIVKNLSKVRKTDVVLMHINHPNSQVYEGFKEGFEIMQAKGLKFEFLKD